MIDGRRYETSSPSLATLATALASIKLPNGNPYTFITDAETTLGTVAILREAAFYQVTNRPKLNGLGVGLLYMFTSGVTLGPN
jgi:hypothetical protein